MFAIAREDIWIYECTADYRKYLFDTYIFKNPEYYKRVNMGRWVGNTPEQLYLIQRSGDAIVVPFGELPHIFKIRNQFEKIFNSLDNKLPQTKDWGSSIVPYDYQQTAIDKALAKRQGVIVAPCSSGKTQIGLAVASKLRRKTLWLTHTQDLLNQSMERAKSVFTLDDADYGKITAGKVDIGNVITFATVQTMSKIDLAKYKNCWDVVIVDECHHIAGTPTKLMMFYKVISNLCARYKYGLTATPERSDGLTGCMFALLGEKVHEIKRSEIANTSCDVHVQFHETGCTPDFEKILMPDGTISHVNLINELVMDEDRNKKIVDDIEFTEGSCLVLTDRVAHVQRLAKMLAERGLAVAMLSANTTKKDREQRKTALADLNNGKLKAVVATFALAKEGLDVKSLRNVFFCTPQKNKTIVTQSAGRVARAAEGKEYGMVHDYVDGSRLLQGWARKRRNIYKGLNYYIH